MPSNNCACISLSNSNNRCAVGLVSSNSVINLRECSIVFIFTLRCWIRVFYHNTPTIITISLKFQGVFNHTLNDTPDPAPMRAGDTPDCVASCDTPEIILDQIFYVLFCVYIFFYCEQVAPHYYGAIPEFVLLYLEKKFGTR